MSKSDLLKFLQSQRTLVIASRDDQEVWATTVFIGMENGPNIYFISPENAKHSKQIIQNKHISFAANWFDPANHMDRKGVQGLGECTIATSDEDIATGVRLHNQNYPEFKDRITVDWVKSSDNPGRVWVIKPSYIKYSDDEVYDTNGKEEFRF